MATPSGAHALASITSGKISPASLLAPSTVISGVRSPRSDVLVLELESTVFRSPALVKPLANRPAAACTPAQRRSNQQASTTRAAKAATLLERWRNIDGHGGGLRCWPSRQRDGNARLRSRPARPRAARRPLWPRSRRSPLPP